MAKRVSFSSQNLSIDEIACYKQDLEKAIRLYYKNYSEYEKFHTYSIVGISEEMSLRLKELELNTIFMLLSSIEAMFRIDFNLRVNKKFKDELSKDFRNIYKVKKNRVSLEEDILKGWQEQFQDFRSIISEYRSALHYRHWLAHGRYWEPKLGRKYDFDSVYILAVHIENYLPLKDVI